MKNIEQLDCLVNSARMFSHNIKMKFELPKCPPLILKRNKVIRSEQAVMAKGQMMKCIE